MRDLPACPLKALLTRPLALLPAGCPTCAAVLATIATVTARAGAWPATLATGVVAVAALAWIGRRRLEPPAAPRLLVALAAVSALVAVPLLLETPALAAVGLPLSLLLVASIPQRGGVGLALVRAYGLVLFAATVALTSPAAVR